MNSNSNGWAIGLAVVAVLIAIAAFFAAVNSPADSGSLGGQSHTNSGLVINEDGTADSTRVESDNQTNMLLVDGTNDRVGIATSSPFTTLGIGSSGTTTVAGQKFCSFFVDEAGRGMWIKLAISGNVVFSTSTSPCNQ